MGCQRRLIGLYAQKPTDYTPGWWISQCRCKFTVKCRISIASECAKFLKPHEVFPGHSPVAGQASLQEFLRTEYSEENILFWLACEEYKKIKSTPEMITSANRIYTEFVQVEAPKQVEKLKFFLTERSFKKRP